LKNKFVKKLKNKTPAAACNILSVKKFKNNNEVNKNKIKLVLIVFCQPLKNNKLRGSSPNKPRPIAV
jgi:hypothetical protein